MVPSFPFTDAECLLCGNCKRNHLLTLSGDDDIIVYIGSGSGSEWFLADDADDDLHDVKADDILTTIA